ncbi:MAG: Mpo1-like protein [Flavobacteriales bacterium]|nr:DUF962 domain-containing protein [Flavobacteriales bacterium]
MATRSMQQWFDAYGASHLDPTNKAIHWVCVPVIYWCVVALLFSIPTPAWSPLPHLWAVAAVVLVTVFYARISIPIMVGMVLWSLFCLWSCRLVSIHVAWPLWAVSVGLFVLAWIGQFYGHKVEGKKPSFLEDIQFLMIGPAWLMGFIYRRLGLSY